VEVASKELAAKAMLEHLKDSAVSPVTPDER
jgi:hypothetical protein